MSGPQTILSILTGIALAAACGFRVFVPLLVVSIAANAGYVSLGPGWEWIARPAAVLCFGVATLLEIGAYYIPWLDNLLDAGSTPAAVVAGTIVTASFIPDMDPLLRWALAAILGGGAAGTVQVATVGLRAASTAATGGLANTLLATGEWLGAAGLSFLALALPILAVLGLVGFAALCWRLLLGRHRGGALASPKAPGH